MKINPLKILAIILISFAFTTGANANDLDIGSSTENVAPQEQKEKPVEPVKKELAEKKVTRVKTAADKELDRRIDDLGKVVKRVEEFKNLTDTDKNAMITVLNGLIGSLNNLRLEIENATSTDNVKQIREMISQNYRVYALVMPQLNIIAAADRMTTTVSMMSIVGAKLEARIGALATSSTITSTNIASARKSLENMKDSLVETQKFIQEAIALVSPLVPDQGDKTIMDSNLATLKEGRTKIKSAQASLVSAKKSAEAAMKLVSKDTKFGKKVGTTTPETN